MTQICQRYSHNMSGAEIDFVLLTVIIFLVHADEHTTNMQNQIISLQDIVQKVLSDVSDIRQQYNVLEHKYNLLSDEFRLLRLNHVSSTKGVRTDEHSSQHVHPMFDHRSTVPSSSPETTLNQKGEQSYFGLQREANIPGFNGNNGQKGEKGDRGPKGDAGLPGFNGDDGYDGDKGEKGVSGIKGDAGMPGFNGDDGIDGPKGEKGESGNSGIQGQKGNIGATGPAGLNGETGDTGPAGQKGNTGTPGPVGQKGNTGTPGQKGNTGTPGPVGQKGNIGTPGPAGQKGYTGTTGPVGQKGAPGMQGPIGLTGLKGQKGLKGDECSIYARIAFFARNDQTINVMAKEKIAFPNIGVNIGTTYERSGVFTCTVTGIYVFTWSTEVNPQKTLITLLLVNGIEHGRLIVQGSVSSWNIGSTTAVLRLSVTDRVYILQDFFTTGTILGNSSFSGFFLYQI